MVSINQTTSSEGMCLETKGLSRRFGSFVAVDSVDLAIPQGEFHSIIGPNGAGKTTLFDMITGILSPSDGEIYFREENITNSSGDERARRGILRVFQSTQIFPSLSVHENLRLAAQSRSQDFNPLSEPNSKFDQQAYKIYEEMDISADLTAPTMSLSHGEKKKVEIAMMIVADPDLLLLDEPTSGVSEYDSKLIFEFIKELGEDVTILLIEHDVNLVLDISDRITVLHNGSEIASGTPPEITENEEVQKAYMGEN